MFPSKSPGLLLSRHRDERTNKTKGSNVKKWQRSSLGFQQGAEEETLGPEVGIDSSQRLLSECRSTLELV